MAKNNQLESREKAALTVDCVVFSPSLDGNRVLLIKRKKAPFQGKWALPGGFLESGESLEDCGRRELIEETGVGGIYLKQFHTFSQPFRDPRGRVITAAYFAIIRAQDHGLRASEDADEAKWFFLNHVPSLAFDHQQILGEGVDAMRSDLIRSRTLFDILPKRFTLSHAQELFECLLNLKLDKRNFRKKFSGFSFVVETKETLRGKKQRPARLFEFDALKFKHETSMDLRLVLI
ncbi:MAG: NUDIX domain-containing protein [Oligoflexales bacterium]